jgi:spermidine/putrescine transport system permease protein
MSGRAFRNIAVGSTMLWILIFVVVPYVFVAVFSFLEYDPAATFVFAFSLSGYREILSSVFLRVCLSSVLMAFFTTVLALGAAYPFAYILTRLSDSTRRVMLLLMIIPFWTSSLVRTYALIVLLKANGIVNTFLLWAGIVHEPLDMLYTEGAVFIGLVYTLLPFMVLPIYTSLQKLDRRLVEAARDLGATSLHVFFRITLPLTMPGIVAGGTMVFLPALGLFYIPDLLGGARTMLIGNYIKNQFLTVGNWSSGSAASVMLTLLMCLFLYGYYLSARKARTEGIGEAP